jgi:protein ImuB
MAIARDFSPRIERHGATEVTLDVSGLGQLLGDAHAIGAELARAGADRIAVAASQIGARLLARANPGVSVPGSDPDGVERALSVLPLPVLKQVVAGQNLDVDADVQAFDILHRWGLRTLGEFAALPAVDLSARLGQRGVALQQLARGIDARPLIPDPGVPRFIESLELEWPIESLEPLSFVFARLLDPLSVALERADRGAAAIRLDLRLTDRTIHTRQLQLPAAMRDPRILRTLLLLDLESNSPAAAVDIVTIEADPAPGRIIQYSLLERALPSAETLATLTARLGALVGADRCGVPSLVDSHRPDGFTLGPVSSLGSTGSVGWLGPLGSCDPTLRRFRPPVAIRVTLESGRPVRIAIDRQGMPGGGVTEAAGPWRTSGAWWDQPSPPLRRSAEAQCAEADAQWNRDEWDVTCSDGAACRIYRDRHSGVWFLDGIFD